MKERKTKRQRKRASSPVQPTILVAAPHEDDDIIGCGGTIKRYLMAGYRVICVFLTRGERGGSSGLVRTKEAVAALKSLGVKSGDIHFGPFKDGEVPYSIETISFLEQFATPEVVAAFVPPVDDCHQDHRNTALSSLAALRRVPSLLAYKTPSALGFAPNVFIDITDHIEAKWAALQLHKSQVEQQKIFMEYTAVDREASAMGLPVRVQYAEGFQSIRYLLDPCPVPGSEEAGTAGTPSPGGPQGPSSHRPGGSRPRRQIRPRTIPRTKRLDNRSAQTRIKGD